MTVYVFAGPTIAAEEARTVLDAVYLPPVAQGDVYRAALSRPAAIGLIDGYFSRVPAVWHKEILWALREGVRVFGAASMGALRAVELAPFGMEGVGEIFAAYRDGAIEADDEVAVAHGGAEDGFRVMSEALVNIRANLAAATAEGVIDATSAAALLAAARGLFYPDRVWPRILELGRGHGLPTAQLDAFAAWLPTARVDRKRQDALALLRVIRQRLDEGLDPPQVDFVFEDTQVWERARFDAGAIPIAAGDVGFPLLLDELRLHGNAYRTAYKDALLRYLMLERAQRLGVTVDDGAVADSRRSFLTAHGLEDPDALKAWLADQALTPRELNRLMREQATLRGVEAETFPHTLRHLPDELRVSGRYGEALRHARRKTALLDDHGGLPSLADLGLTEAELMHRFFARRGADVPDDLPRYARRAGFASFDAFRRAVLADHVATKEDRDGHIR